MTASSTAERGAPRSGRPPGGPPPSGARPRRRVSPQRDSARLGVRRTLYALLAAALGMIPLKGLFYDWGWLLDVWVTMIVVIGPAALMRRRRPPGALDIWPGIVLLIPWLTLRFVHAHAIGGFIPTHHTWRDVSALLTNLHHTTRDDVAPIHTTVAVRLVICALLGLLAALIDLIAVVGHRGALAGVPLLIVYTVAGAVPRRPVSWVWFAFAAVGYLILLGLDAGDDVQSWGRRIHVSRDSRSKSPVSVSTPRIAVAAIVVAVVLPLLVPGQSRNLLSNAFHHGAGGSGVGGFGAEGGGSISPFAALKGELDQSVSIPMATVHLQPLNTAAARFQAFYLRVNVLSKYTGQEWTLDSHGDTDSLGATGFGTDPATTGRESTAAMQATVSVLGLTGNAPIFTVPTKLTGLSGDTTYSRQDELLLGSKVSRGDQYTEQFNQPEPTTAELNAATGPPGAALDSLMKLPANFPAYARGLTDKIVKRANTPYERALAISNYFTDPANGFIYELKTDRGDSGSELVDFLKHKRGFCQQYAASMGLMLRAAGIPSRVVLGYMHDVPDQGGDFTVTSSEAHAWVEAYFTGIGWVPFDPTPTAGLVGGAKTDLPWAQHDYPKAPTNTKQPKLPGRSVKPLPTHGLGGPTPKTTATKASSDSLSLAALGWLIGGLVVLVLVLVPAMARVVRRRRRYLAARRDGDADALWAELSDTAVDLGFVWSPARTPRQVASWLGRDATGAASSLQALASAVEYGRYAPNGGAEDTSGLVTGLRSVTGELRAGRSRGTRLRAVLWPASLGWGSRLRGFGRRSR